MHRPLAGILTALVVSACVASPPPSSSPSPSPSPPPPISTDLWLRVTQTQALPPVNRFAWLPLVAVTGDLVLVVPGPMIEIYPGPLVPSLAARSITPRGWAAIVDEARSMGLLGGRTDFVPADVALGQPLGRIELLVDGVRFDLTGDPSRLVRCGAARCVPGPGTPEAFAAFWQRLADLQSWIGGELGGESPYVADAVAILVGIPPAEQPPQPQFLEWPLETGLAGFGRPIGNDPAPRCGIVRGPELDALRPSLLAANQLTRWVDAVDAIATIAVRPLLPGEDVCAELFGA